MIPQTDTVLEEILSTYPDHARVWIYQANRPFTEKENINISGRLASFNENWESHGRPVHSAATTLYDRFVAFVIDDTSNKAGGCSIDTSVHLMKQIEQDMNIELFNRLQVVAYSAKGELTHFHFSETPGLLENGTLNASSTVFNNAISTLKQLKEEWQIPLENSWLKKYL